MTSNSTEVTPGLRVRVFNCQCGSPVFFRNSMCLACQTPLGYLAEAARLTAIAPAQEPGAWIEWRTEGPQFRRCANLDTPASCNWLLPFDEAQVHNGLCRSCRLNRVIPNLDDPSHPDNGELWGRFELAKRRLVSALLVMGLPVASRETEDTQQGVAFDFLRAPPGAPPVITGHDNGLITLNIEEADDLQRERVRTHMNEPYRTLVGHLRHEIGHYYWARLIDGSHWLEQFRALFGDENVDYGASLAAYYHDGPSAGWQGGFISAYATSHPWEDWAECWAHYMHMSDMVDTASSFGLSLDESRLEFTPFTRDLLYQGDHPGADKYLSFINHWARLTMMMNGMARAMGQPEIYPFVLAHQVIAKLQFIHLVVSEERHRWDDHVQPLQQEPSQGQAQSQ